MKDVNQRELEELVADPRYDSEGFTPDTDIAEVWDSEVHRGGIEDGGRRRREQMEARSGHDPDLAAGDPDVNLEFADSVGEEAIGGPNPHPDTDRVDEIGRAVGIEYQDSEPLHTTKKLEDRDRHRWELNPASSEDFPDRKHRL